MKKFILIFVLLFVPITIQSQTEIQIKWGDSTPLVLYDTNLFGGSDADIGGTKVYTDSVDLVTGGFDAIALTFKVDPSGTTDDLEVEIFSQLVATEFDSTEIAEISFEIGQNSGAQRKRTILMWFKPYFRIGLLVGGTPTDTYDVEITARRFLWESQ